MRLSFPYHQRPIKDSDAYPGITHIPTPWIPVRLFRGKDSSPRIRVLVDSGADYALFHAQVAPHVGISDYTTGQEAKLHGIGQAKCWIHEGLGVFVKDSAGNKVAVSLRAGFAPDLKIMGVLGREFFFEAFSVMFDQVGEEIHLDLREDASNIVNLADVPIYKPQIPKAKRGYQQQRARRK